MRAAVGDWDPDQYRRFAFERAQPFWDLVALIEPRPIGRAVDLGCGTGELTAALAEKLAIREMVGIDASEAMLAEAATHARPGLRFEHGELAAWPGPTHKGPHDLVFANASLHWAPDHETVIARWVAALGEHGQLAVQVPANADHPAHLLAAEVANTEPFRSALGGEPPPDQVARNVLRPEHYSTLLYDLGLVRQHVRLQVYAHVLPSTGDIVEWMRGTTLNRFFAVLPLELHGSFVGAYRRRVLAELGDRSPCFFPFKRILMWAAR